MKKSKIQIIVASAVGVSLLAGLAGCGGNNPPGKQGAGAAAGAQAGGAAASGNTAGSAASTGDEVVINYPTFQCGVNTAAPVVARLVEEFNAEYAGRYRIKLEEVPGDANYVDKIKVQLGTGDLPPVVYGGGYNLLDLALARDLVVDLTEIVGNDPEWEALYSDASLTANSRDGKIYASSVEGSIVGYFYNKELFAQAGIAGPAATWEEFFQQCEQLKTAGITPLAMDTADSAWVTQLWLGAMVATSGSDGLAFMQTMNPDGYQTPEMVAAVGQIQRMLKEYTTLDAIGGKYENAANNFLSGQAAMIANGPWMIGDFSDPGKALPEFADKVGTAVYPGGFVYDAPIQGYFVTKQENKQVEEAAIAMVKFFTSQHAQELGLEMQGMVPAAQAAAVSGEVAGKYPLLAEFMGQATAATVRSDNMQATMYSNLLDVISQELPRLYSDELDAAAFCEALTVAAQKN